jgi:hypothetical protein
MIRTFVSHLGGAAPHKWDENDVLQISSRTTVTLAIMQNEVAKKRRSLMSDRSVW